jgi:hypothetical protein
VGVKFVTEELRREQLGDNAEDKQSDQLTKEERSKLWGELSLEELVAGERNPEDTIGAQLFGTTVHKLLSQVDWRSSTPLTAQIKAPPRFTEEDRHKMDHYLNYVDSLPVRQRLLVATNLGAEIPFSLVLGQHRLRGKIDCVGYDVTEIPGGLVNDANIFNGFVIDWKTGEDPEDLFAADYALQRKLYSLAVLSQENPPTSVEAIWVGSELETETYTLEDLPEMRRLVSAEIEQILEKEPIAAATTPQLFCEGCPGLQVVCTVSRSHDN